MLILTSFILDSTISFYMRILSTHRAVVPIVLGVVALFSPNVSQASGTSAMSRGWLLDVNIPENVAGAEPWPSRAEITTETIEEKTLQPANDRQSPKGAMTREASPLSFVAGAFALFGAIQLVRKQLRVPGRLGPRYRTSRLSELTQRRVGDLR